MAPVILPTARIGVVLSAGGERLVPWHTGVLAGLADGGLDLRRADPVLGTSAGALVAARLAAGIDPRPLADALAARACPPVTIGATPSAAQLFAQLAQLAAGPATPAERARAIGRVALEHSPGGEEEHVERVRARLGSLAWPPALWIAAVDAGTGERVVFRHGDDAPLDRALAAARSVPVLLPPVRVGRRRCIDAAVRSSTNAEVLAGAGVDVAVVLTGSAEPEVAVGPDVLWNAALAGELRALERAGVEPLVLRADDADREAMGPDPMSRATAPLSVVAGRRRGRALAGRLAASVAA